jgi:hypothetical protein
VTAAASPPETGNNAIVSGSNKRLGTALLGCCCLCWQQRKHAATAGNSGSILVASLDAIARILDCIPSFVRPQASKQNDDLREQFLSTPASPAPVWPSFGSVCCSRDCCVVAVELLSMLLPVCLVFHCQYRHGSLPRTLHYCVCCCKSSSSVAHTIPVVEDDAGVGKGLVPRQIK